MAGFAPEYKAKVWNEPVLEVQPVPPLNPLNNEGFVGVEYH